MVGRFCFDRHGSAGIIEAVRQRCVWQGCKGRRLIIRWQDGHVSHECEHGMCPQPDGSMRIV